MISNGGMNQHLVPHDSQTAICGYKPSSPNGSIIRNRGHWNGIDYAKEGSIKLEWICPKCLKRATSLAKK